MGNANRTTNPKKHFHRDHTTIRQGCGMFCFTEAKILQKLKSYIQTTNKRNRTVNTCYFTIFYSLFFHAHFLKTAYRH